MSTLFACTLLSAYPNWSDVENILISNADVVFVGVYQGIGESRDVPILDEAGRETGKMIQLDRHDYRPILVLRGEVRAALVSLLYLNAGRMKGQPVPVGTTQIQYGYAPRGNLFRTNGLVDYFHQTGPNQFYNNWLYYQSQANVPNKTYLIEGDTPVERYISVLVQAYQSEPENVALLERAKSVMPQVQIRDGRPVIENGRLVIVAGQDNPCIYEFRRREAYAPPAQRPSKRPGISPPRTLLCVRLGRPAVARGAPATASAHRPRAAGSGGTVH